MERAWADLYWAGIETQVLVRYFYASVAGLLQPEAIRFWVIRSVLVNQISGTRWIFITSGANVHNVKGQCQFCPSRLLVPKPCSTSRNHHYQVKAACSLVIFYCEATSQETCLQQQLLNTTPEPADSEHDETEEQSRCFKEQTGREKLQSQATKALRGGAGPKPVLEEWISEARCDWNSKIQTCNTNVWYKMKLFSAFL